MKKDIKTREDLLQLVTRFYQKLFADDTINYIFTDVAKIDLAHHLPVLVDFWDMILFGNDTYRKNAMQPHMTLHNQVALTPAHFTAWLTHFKSSVDELFEGNIAFLAKERATSIATVMQIRIAQQHP